MTRGQKFVLGLTVVGGGLLALLWPRSSKAATPPALPPSTVPPPDPNQAADSGSTDDWVSGPRVDATISDLQTSVPGQTYIVQHGDSLSSISRHFYGTVDWWPIIYNVNRETIQANYNLIKPNMSLVIPDAYSISQADIDQAEQIFQSDLALHQ